MTTPIRSIPDFDMQSARRDPPVATPQVSRQDYSSMSLPTGGQGASNREMEQRFAKLVAESEYKLLEERGRAHEREAKLREELAREKSQIPKLVQEKVDKAVAERERELQAQNEGKYSTGGGANKASSSADVENIKQQLVETQRLLADAERRYQQEKRELLNLRTAQLKNETSKRGQEGDIVGRAMQVMSEYETIIRSSEENSLARLAHHMENFEKEWIRRSREFEERKTEFEGQVMTKALEALQTHNQDVDAIGHQIVDKTLGLLRQHSESRLQLEEQVLHHAEQFKLQYKEMLETEFRERCRVYDERLADRERNLTKILEHERQRIIQVEKEAVTAHEQMHVDALTDAMGDISKLREQLVREHQEQQGKAMAELVERRNQMRDEQTKMIEAANERVREVEQQCFEAVDSAQRALKEMQLHVMNREAELTKQLMDINVEKDQQRLRDVASTREEVDKHWYEVVEGLRAEHLTEIQRLTADFNDRIDREHAEQYAREAEVRKIYEHRMIKVEESADQRWAARVAEGSRALDRHLEVIQALRDDNEQLTAQLATFQQQFLLREQEMSQKVSQIQREHEAVWHRKMEEMRVRYDQLLDEALGGPQGESVSRGEHEKVLEQVRELEERCVQIKQQESQRLQHERDHLNELWKNRLEEERSERAVWEQDQLSRLSDLRVEIYADARRKETEALRRAEQERIHMHEESMGRTLEERRDRDAYEERVRLEADTRIREAEEELNDAYQEKVRILERRVEEKEVLIEKRRLDLKREYAAMEEASKKQAAEWLEKEKKEILSDVKKFHERLVEEQQRIETERISFEQRLSMQYAEEFEQAKAALQVHMTTMTRNHMTYWSNCEQEWLHHRAEEMRLMFEQRMAHDRLVKDQANNLIQIARDDARSLVRSEREAMDSRESEIFAEMEKQRIALEVTARERALALLDERNKIQEAAEVKRAEEEAKLWEQLERRILDKERQAESDRRVLEMELRNRYEGLMNSERHRMDALMDQYRTEARELYDKQQQALRLRDEEWHRQRLSIDAEERANHDRTYQSVRDQAETRVQEERRRCEAAMHLREQEFDAERLRGLDALEKQLRDHELATRSQLKELKDDYDRRVRMIAQEMHHQREEYIADLAEQERRAQSSRDEYEQAALAKFEKNLKELRSIMEKRQREQSVRELDARDQLEKQRREFEEKISKQYEELLKSHEAKLLSMEEAREAQSLRLEQEHQQQLLAVRADMEQTLTKYFAQADGRSKELAESTRQQFQTKLEEYYTLIAQERRKRVDAENALAMTNDEKEALTLSMEQYKLDIQRSVQQKYETVFVEMREKSRREREEQARKQLAEEEKRLANEILRSSDPQIRRPAASSASTTNLDASAHLYGTPMFPTTTSSGPGTSTYSNPFVSSSGGGTPSTSSTPAAAASSQQRLLHTTAPPPPPMSMVPSSVVVDTAAQSAAQYNSAPASSNRTQPPTSSGGADPMMDSVNSRREKLKQLWQVLDVPETDRNRFLDTLVGASPVATLEALTTEVKRLELQLPLLEVITRREFIQHRMRELEKKPQPTAATQKQLEEFGRELLKLTDHLRVEIPKYESRQGHLFMFRGKRFMNVLLNEVELDARQMAAHSPVPQQRAL